LTTHQAESERSVIFERSSFLTGCEGARLVVGFCVAYLVLVVIDTCPFLLAQKGTEKGRPNSTGLTARSLWPGKGELQKLTPCGCSNMLRPAEVPLRCNPNPFAEPQRAQGWMGNCNKDALRALSNFSALKGLRRHHGQLRFVNRIPNEQNPVLSAVFGGD